MKGAEKNMAAMTPKPSKYMRKLHGTKLECVLCPRHCALEDGGTGYCQTRTNSGGAMMSLAYGYPVALQVDPIEKKPLRHFMPGTRTFSLGTFGCNLGCLFCQNASLSRGSYNPRGEYQRLEPEDVVSLAVRYGCKSVAFTYNEPTVWLEYALDIAKKARAASLGTVLVSNGYIEQAPMEEFYPFIDAANIDMKGYDENFYKELCGDASLEVVKRSCEYFKNTVKGHLELTNLVIPGRNDSDEKIDAYLDWVESSLGRDTCLHFSAYHPAHRFLSVPATPRALIEKICAHALERGFDNVFSGNI